VNTGCFSAVELKQLICRGLLPKGKASQEISDHLDNCPECRKLFNDIRKTNKDRTAR
jgi:predicted anti-sigma-YlaC factor YlaD